MATSTDIKIKLANVPRPQPLTPEEAAARRAAPKARQWGAQSVTSLTEDAADGTSQIKNPVLIDDPQSSPGPQLDFGGAMPIRPAPPAARVFPAKQPPKP